MDEENTWYRSLKKEIKVIAEYALNWLERFFRIVIKYAIAIIIMVVGIGIAGGISYNSMPSENEVKIVKDNLDNSIELSKKSERRLKEVTQLIDHINNGKLTTSERIMVQKLLDLNNLNKQLISSNKALVDTNQLLLSHTNSGIRTTVFMQFLSFFIGIASSITATAVIKSKL